MRSLPSFAAFPVEKRRSRKKERNTQNSEIVKPGTITKVFRKVKKKSTKVRANKKDQKFESEDSSEKIMV